MGTPKYCCDNSERFLIVPYGTRDFWAHVSQLFSKSRLHSGKYEGMIGNMPPEFMYVMMTLGNVLFCAMAHLGRYA